MEIVLSTTMHRRIQLLNTLSTANNWLHLDEVASLVESSKKTVASDCQYIEDHWPDIVTIETSQKHGIRLVEAVDRSVHEIYIEMIRNSNAFSLLEGVFFEPGQSSDYWEQKLFMSKSSLYRVSRRLNQALARRNIELNSSPFVIQGANERQVRYFLALYFLEVYGIHEWPFDIDRYRVYSLIAKVNQELSLKLNNLQIIEVMFLTAVTLHRENQGYFCEDNQLDRRLYQKRAEQFRAYSGEMREIMKPLGIEIQASWFDDFCSSVFWWEFGWDNPQEKMRNKELANNFIQILLDAFKISITDESREKVQLLFEYIYARHKVFPYKKYIVYHRAMFSRVKMQKNFVLYSRVIEKALKAKEEKYKFPWYSMYFDDILQDVIARWNGLADMLLDNRPEIKIGIFSDLGVEHAQLMAHFIGRHSFRRVELVIQNRPFHEVNHHSFPDLEFYISNFNIGGIPEEKLLIVDDIPSFKNQVELRQRIDARRLTLAEKIPYLEN